MITFNPEQALARFIELHEKRGQEIDHRPDLQLQMARGNYDFMVDADYEIRELEREAERNGFYLEWTFDRDKNGFEYTCRKMTPEEDEEDGEWEKEE
jgi:2-hydroxychromene-2-carboxylate isomerase